MTISMSQRFFVIFSNIFPLGTCPEAGIVGTVIDRRLRKEAGEQ